MWLKQDIDEAKRRGGVDEAEAPKQDTVQVIVRNRHEKRALRAQVRKAERIHQRRIARG